MAPSTAAKQEAGTARWRRLATAILLAAYFLFFARDGLSAGWAADDLSNLYYAWKPGPWKLLLSQFTLWRGDYRPMGGAFYVAFYNWFGLEPFPYRLAILIILGFNVWLAYKTARLLGCERIAATLAAAVISYHGGLGALHYNTDVIYDILCFTFYVGALAYYVSIRRKGRLPGAGQFVALLALFLCALNSKEMAVTLPPVLLAYEAFYHTPSLRGWRKIREWLFGPARFALAGTFLNFIYIYGKKFGPDPLMSIDSYKPVFSMARFVRFQLDTSRDLFFATHTTLWLLALWTVLTWWAWRENRPILRFFWAFLLLTPLPIEFLDGRYQSCIYIPTLGWAVLGALGFVELAFGVARFIARPRFLRGTGERAIIAILMALALRYWVQANWKVHREYVVPAMLAQYPEVQQVLKQFRAIKPRVPPRSEVVFLKEPFGNYDMIYIANLVFSDRSVNVHLQPREHLPDAELAKMVQFSYESGNLLRVK